MNKFLKGLTISTGCNVVSSLGKMVVYAQMNFSTLEATFLQQTGWVSLGKITATSYLTSTVPALVGYGVGSLVDNGFGKQVLSVPTAIALTAGAECFTNGCVPTPNKITPDNFTLWSYRADITWKNFKSTDKIQDQKSEMIDFANTFIQTELFNIFLPDAALDFAEIDLESITDTIENDSDSIDVYENAMADYSSDF